MIVSLYVFCYGPCLVPFDRCMQANQNDKKKPKKTRWCQRGEGLWRVFCFLAFVNNICLQISSDSTESCMMVFNELCEVMHLFDLQPNIAQSPKQMYSFIFTTLKHVHDI